MKHVLRSSQRYFYSAIFRPTLGNPASINRYQQAE